MVPLPNSFRLPSQKARLPIHRLIRPPPLFQSPFCASRQSPPPLWPHFPSPSHPILCCQSHHPSAACPSNPRPRARGGIIPEAVALPSISFPPIAMNTKFLSVLCVCPPRVEPSKGRALGMGKGEIGNKEDRATEEAGSNRKAKGPPSSSHLLPFRQLCAAAAFFDKHFQVVGWRRIGLARICPPPPPPQLSNFFPFFCPPSNPSTFLFLPPPNPSAIFVRFSNDDRLLLHIFDSSPISSPQIPVLSSSSPLQKWLCLFLAFLPLFLFPKYSGPRIDMDDGLGKIHTHT